MQMENRLHTRPVDALSALVVGFYAWGMTLMFGATLLDILYAKLVPGASVAFSEAADFLLLLTGVIMLAAIPAIGLAWKVAAARYFLIASLMILLLSFLIPPFLGPLLEGSGWGTVIRIALGAVVSILAFVGAHRYFRQT